METIDLSNAKVPSPKAMVLNKRPGNAQNPQRRTTRRKNLRPRNRSGNVQSLDQSNRKRLEQRNEKRPAVRRMS